MIVERYIKIDEKSNSIPGSFVFVDKTKVEILHRNLLKLEFKNLYANIATKLWDTGYIRDDGDKFLMFHNIRELLNNNANSDFFRIPLSGLFRYNDIYNITISYARNFYQELIIKTSNIIYIDTDSLIYKDSLPQELLEELGLQYTITQVDYLYFIYKQKYISCHDNVFKTHGLVEHLHMNRFKGLIREERINQIFE